MGAQGTTTIDFGAFPGKTDASVAVTGQTGILASSLVEAWLYPVATADHSVDEHIALSHVLRPVAHSIVAGTGFTISMVAPENPGDGQHTQDVRSQQSAKDGLCLYGLWTVGWCWSD